MVADTLYGHIYLDNFQFARATSSPVGSLESVSLEQKTAIGWSADPDSPSQANPVDCYIDGQYAGRVTANLAGAGAPNPPYTGNHRFSFSIPADYQDGLDHQINCHGIDISGGDPSTLLPGSPKTFNIAPNVISTTFVELQPGQLSPNNNAGGGLRMFPERTTPTGPVNNKINVKAKISANRAGVWLYFRSHDLDDPSAAGPPIDVDVNGQDNRSPATVGNLCADSPSGCEYVQPSIYRVSTNASGEAVIPFALTQAHPGDNYAISAATTSNEAANTVVDGIALRNNLTGQTLTENVTRTPMLTAWRTLHIERDSMGVAANSSALNVQSDQQIGSQDATIITNTFLDAGRFENGRLIVGGGVFLNIVGNGNSNMIVNSPGGPVSIYQGYQYTIYDDDDFNLDNSTNGFDADHGEDIEELYDTYYLVRSNDDANCADVDCNAFAAAYIQPSFVWGDQYSNTNIAFNQNVDDTPKEVSEQIELGRYSLSGENDQFWVAYIQIAYQHSVEEDGDPNTDFFTNGATPARPEHLDNDASSAASVRYGGVGSLIYIESTRDFSFNGGTGNIRLRVVPHEIGHQMGLFGDNSELPTNFGIMSATGPLLFVDRHLNVLRWRVKSPGT